MDDLKKMADPGTCLGRTCLKWGRDGDLTRLDYELVLQRLAQVDRQMAAECQRNPACLS